MQEIGTVSSERLAELAGVNAAKVRKDLSYLGSYGTRGVGYDVEYLLHEISRELGLTHDWPVAIVGVGNLGQALANYHGFGARGFRVVAAVDADPEKVGQAVGDLTIESLDDLPAIARGTAASPSASSPRRPTRPRRWPTAWSRRGSRRSSTSRPPSWPRRRVSRCARSTSPSSCRSCPSTNSGATSAVLARDRERRTAAAACAEPDERTRPPISGYPGEPGRRRSSLRRGGCRPHRGPQDRGAPRRGRRRHVCRARRRPPRCAAWADAGPAAPSPSGPFEPADLDGAWLATTATGDPEVDHAVFEAGEERRIWVNSADDPANCSFTLMSVVRQGDLVVTIGTGGRSPALATWLRRRLAGGARARVRDLLDMLVGGPGRAPGVGAFALKTPIGVGARFRHARSDPRRERGRSQGDPPGMSLVVVGLNHRTVPVEPPGAA